MKDPAQLAKCLRCISTPGGTPLPCDYTECVYDCTEPVTEKTKEFEALAEDDGCFHSIDCDRIGLDAAELIEKLRRENRQFRAAFDKAATESAYFKAAFVKACEANDDLFKKLIKMKAERDAAVKASGNGEEHRMKNTERIRSMSAYDLAMFLDDIANSCHSRGCKDCPLNASRECSSRNIEDWLNEEADNG